MRREVGQPDGDEIFERIVVELGLHERIDGQRAVRSGEQRVAVRRCGRDRSSAETAARAGARFNDDRLAERCRHALGDDPRHEVGVAARRERHDQPDRLVRIGGEGLARQHRREWRGCEGGQERAA
jgi:hypothetical protein